MPAAEPSAGRTGACAQAIHAALVSDSHVCVSVGFVHCCECYAGKDSPVLSVTVPLSMTSWAWPSTGTITMVR